MSSGFFVALIAGPFKTDSAQLIPKPAGRAGFLVAPLTMKEVELFILACAIVTQGYFKLAIAHDFNSLYTQYIVLHDSTRC